MMKVASATCHGPCNDLYCTCSHPKFGSNGDGEPQFCAYRVVWVEPFLWRSVMLHLKHVPVYGIVMESGNV